MNENIISGIYTMNTMGMRVFVTPEMAKTRTMFSPEEIGEYVNLLLAWLDYLGITVLEQTCGIHLQSRNRDHIHFHTIIDKEFPFSATPLDTFKNHLKGKKCPLETELRLKDCVSIQVKKIVETCEEHDLTFNNGRYLGYVFKEKLPVLEHTKTSYDVEALTLSAAAEYESICVKKEKALNATMKTQDHKTKVEEYLKAEYPPNYELANLSCGIHNPLKVIANALKEFADKDYPVGKTAGHAYQYCYAMGWIPYELIIDRYCGKELKEYSLFKLGTEEPIFGY